MGVVNIVINELKPAFLIGLASGVMAMLLAIVIGALPTDAISQIVVSVALLVLLVILATKTRLKGIGLYEAVKLFAAIGIVGSIISLVLPAVGGYILTAPEFTWSGLMMTFIYVGLGLYVLKAIGQKA